jgi:nicotinate-nucleotide adenylyltransferase
LRERSPVAGAAAVNDKAVTPTWKRVGVFLGSFNPPHAGHKLTVENMKKEFGLDAIYVVPDRSTAYKKLEDLSLREEMVRGLFAGDDSIQFLTPEMQQASASGEMWDVLRAVREGHPGADVYDILGSDTLRWWSTLPEAVRASAGPVQFLVNDRNDGGSLPGEVDGQKLHVVSGKDAGLSSTQMRQAIAAGKKPDALSNEVWAVIQKHNLYGFGGAA